MASLLMSLPRELRNRIYHHLWATTPLTILPARSAWYDQPPTALGLVSGVSRGMPTWLRTSRAILTEGIEEFHVAGTIEVDLGASVQGGGLLAADTARHILVTLALTPIQAVPAAVWRDICPQGGQRFGEVIGNAAHLKKCTVVVTLDREARVAEVIDFSALDILVQTEVSRIELWVGDVRMGSVGELAIGNEIAGLANDVFEDMQLEVKTIPVQLPQGFGVGGQEACVWRCTFLKD
jgi:hypothetical protein